MHAHGRSTWRAGWIFLRPFPRSGHIVSVLVACTCSCDSCTRQYLQKSCQHHRLQRVPPWTPTNCTWSATFFWNLAFDQLGELRILVHPRKSQIRYTWRDLTCQWRLCPACHQLPFHASRKSVWANLFHFLLRYPAHRSRHWRRASPCLSWQPPLHLPRWWRSFCISRPPEQWLSLWLKSSSPSGSSRSLARPYLSNGSYMVFAWEIWRHCSVPITSLSG